MKINNLSYAMIEFTKKKQNITKGIQGYILCLDEIYLIINMINW